MTQRMPLIFRTGQIIAGVVAVISLIGGALPLFLQGAVIALGIEWIWRRKRHWLGLPRDDK